MAEAPDDVVGLIPAAGRARRLGDLPCSKEILPVGFCETPQGPRPRAACEPLLEGFRRAGIPRAWVLLRRGKWDIPAYLGERVAHGELPPLELAYRVLDPTASVPETLNAARPFIAGQRVALGFPDIFFTPRDAFSHLLTRQDERGSNVVLGLFPTDTPHKTDMVALDGERVRRIVIKPEKTDLIWTWSIAVWDAEFTEFLHAAGSRPREQGHEWWIGEVIQEAIDQGLQVDAVTFPEGSYLDVGTPRDLRRAAAE